MLPGAGVVLALLAGLGVYRWRSRARSESGETSFLESRLQPDSFFGASGGQRIDTREGTATASPSTMSYSLSQLDAIGDVDPVAEADVYLAYGRDLQAEEILKEAMARDKSRHEISLKLLEIYRRRGDREASERIRERFNRRFNAYAPEWQADPQQGRTLTDYPSVVASLQSLWATPERAMRALEASLFRRDGSASTFDLPAYRDLLTMTGAERIHPADLWQFDWSWRTIALEPGTPPRSAGVRKMQV